MKKTAALLYSVLNDGPIVGYFHYLRYRLGPLFGRTAPMQVTVGEME